MADQPEESNDVASQPVEDQTPINSKEKFPEDLDSKRCKAREAQLRNALVELEKRHKAERLTLSKELRELSAGRTAIKDQIICEYLRAQFGLARSPEDQVKLLEGFPRADQRLIGGEKERELDTQSEKLVEPGEEEIGEEKQHLLNQPLRQSPREGSSSSNVKEAEAEEIPPWLENVLKSSQDPDVLKRELLKELVPVWKETRVDLQSLLEVFDENQLRKAYALRILREDKRELQERDRKEAERQAGCWRFLSKTSVEAQKNKLEERRTCEGDISYVDGKRLGVPKLPGCYEEIKNLLDIEKNPIFDKALEEWNRKEDLFSHRVERKKNRVADLKNEIYQLIGFFSVFQGVVLTAVSQSSYLYCSNRWSPISLSVLASVVSIFGVLQKLFQINELQTNIDSEERDFKTAVQVGQRLRGQGPKGFDFVQLSLEIDKNNNRQSKFTKRRHLAWLYFALVTLTLVAFGVLFPVSYWRILCHSGSAPAESSPAD